MFNLFSKSPFKGHSGTIAGIAVSPDGSKVVSGAHTAQFFDGDAIIWRLRSGERERRLRGHAQLYPGLGADFVMESVTLIIAIFGEEKAQSCEMSDYNN